MRRFETELNIIRRQISACFYESGCRLTSFVTLSGFQCLDEARKADGKCLVSNRYEMAVMGEACSGSTGNVSL